MKELSESEQYTIVSALRVAAQKYADNAAQLREHYAANPQDAIQRLAARFDMQATEANRLAFVIEAAEVVVCR